MKNSIILLIAILFVACGQSEADLLKNNIIDSKIRIDIREYLDTRKIILNCATEKVYPCINYGIASKQHLDRNNLLSVTFTDIIDPGICLTAIGPAKGEVDLSNLSNQQYELELNNGNLKNWGVIKISDSEIVLDFKNQKGIEIVTPVLKRVPDKTYWGTIGYARQSSENAVNQFINKLSTIGVEFNKQSPGYYFYYEIDGKGKIIYESEGSGYYHGKGLIFQYKGDESTLKNLIHVDGKEYLADDIYISIWTYKGEHFYNWGN